MTDMMPTADPAAMAEPSPEPMPPMPPEGGAPDMGMPPEGEMPPEAGMAPETPSEPPAEGEGGPDTELPAGPEATIGEPKTGGEIEKIAEEYVIPISDEAIKKWKKAGPEEFKKYAEQVAIGMYPTFAPQIQAGMTTDVLLDPYVEVAKQTLGPVMGDPNWSDPKWSAALQGSIDPKTGRRIPMSLDEWRQHLMTHPGHNWEFTPQAHEKAQQFSDIINNAFGSKGQ